MTCAYDEMYLPQARETMGAMLDYAAWDCKIDIDVFFGLFVTSGFADRFGRGNPSIVAGKSGPEIAWDVFYATGYTAERPKPRYNMNRSREYWTGWILAHYQWHTAMSFREIMAYLPPSRARSLYSPFHERDPRAFVERADAIYLEGKKETNLKRRREARRMTQTELSAASGVPLRTLQQYEQRQKDIRKANIDYALSLARVLGCSVEDIIDYTPKQDLRYTAISKGENHD